MSDQNNGDAAISDRAVREATGRGRRDWFTMLDEWGAVGMEHEEIARRLGEDTDLSGWWAQMITVQYERERGLRKVGQRRGGAFEVSVQRTLGADPATTFDALTQTRHLAHWYAPGSEISLEEGGHWRGDAEGTATIRALDPPRRLLFDWNVPTLSPGTAVELRLEEAGDERTMLRVTHSKLPSQVVREKARIHWRAKLDHLQSYLEEE